MTTPDVVPLRHPRGLTPVAGNPGWAYEIAPTPRVVQISTGKDGEEKIRPVLDWCPVVSARLVELRDDGTIAGRYFRVTLGDVTDVFSYEAILSGEIWQHLEATGGARRSTREALADVITSQAMRLPRTIATSRTGWHGPAGYALPDGRTIGGEATVEVIGMPPHLVRAAAPVRPAGDDQVRAALDEIVAHGGWAPLFGISVGARSFGQSLRPVPAGVIFHGDPNTGKTCSVAAGRMLVLAPDWPPPVTCRFSDTITDMEHKINVEADMPTLIDDLALTASASSAEQRDAVAKLEMIIRSVGNQTAMRGRRKRDLTAQESCYVRSIPAITAQRLPYNLQASLIRRCVLVRLRQGDAAWQWWQVNAPLVAPALRTIGTRIITRLGAADDPVRLLGDAEHVALGALMPCMDTALPDWRTRTDGMTGVVHHAAAMLAGLVLVAEAAKADVGRLLDVVAGPLARALAEQADALNDQRLVTDDVPAAIGDVIRRALWDRRAHLAGQTGALGPDQGPEWLDATEMGLRQTRDGMITTWEGNGPALYWLPTYGAVGIKSDALHDLARASGDPRVSGYTARSLSKALGRAKALVTPQRERLPQKVRLGDRTARLLLIRTDVIWSERTDDPGDPSGLTDAPPAPPSPEPGSSAGPLAGPAGGDGGNGPAAGPAPVPVLTPVPEPVVESAPAHAPAPELAPAVHVTPAGPTLAVAADEHGIYLGDGRALDPAGAYESMPAFLARVAELMPDGGTVAITLDVARALGYPDRPQNAKPGKARAGSGRRAAKREECRAAADAAAAGWQHSAAGIGAWTAWHGEGRPSIAVVVLDKGWLDPKRMGVSGEPFLRADHDPVTAAYLLSRYRELTGVPYTMTAGTSGVHMLRAEFRGRRRVPLFKWDGHGSPAEDVQEHAAVWTRQPTDDERAMPYVIGYDVRAAYLAAAGVADLAVNALEHVGVNGGFDRAGYWLVSTPGRWQPYPMLPPLSNKGGDRAAWLTTPTVRLLLEHGMPEEAIVDAWLSSGRSGHTARLLRRPAERLRDALAELADATAEDAEVRSAIKATYRETVGMLRRGTAWVMRPDWSDTIIAQSRANLLRKAIKIGHKEGRWPLKIDTDCLYYAAPTDDPREACPAGLRLWDPSSMTGAGLGTVTAKHVIPMADFLSGAEVSD